MTAIPQFSLPFRLEGPDFAVSEQDTLDEITDCVQAIIRYPVGYRIELPEFGTPDQTFHVAGPSTAEIQAALQRWEPRATTLTTAELEEALATVRVEVEGGTI